MAIDRIVGDSDSLQVDWSLGNNCNYNCRYCADDAKDGSWRWPSINNCIKTLNAIHEHYNKKQYVYTLLGGELTLWKDFNKFIDAIHETTPHSKIKLLTNGRMPPFYWEMHGHKFDAIQFSYHAENVKNDTEFYRSVVACNCRNINVFIMMDPAHWDRCVAMYEKMKRAFNVRTVAPKPLDNRAEGHVSSLYEYTDKQTFWMKTNFWSNNRIKGLRPLIRTRVERHGIIETIEPNDLILNDNNKWKGWECSIGIEKLALRIDGEITRGSACNVGESLGNWRTATDFNFPTQWAVCPKDACFCGTDISVSKQKKVHDEEVQNN